MSDRPYNVLFLSVDNSTRSVMAEALLNTLGRGRFHAYSAGSDPQAVHPLTLEQVAAFGCSGETLRSKSCSEFDGPGAPRMDFVIGLCDKAAGEVPPVWPGQLISGHWSFEDPAATQGTDAEKRQAFEKVFRQLQARIRYFVNLPVRLLDAAAIQREITMSADAAV
jgi:arsenate reductase